MAFRFTCVGSECSAVEVACLAQNILHSSASVRLHLVALRCVGVGAGTFLGVRRNFPRFSGILPGFFIKSKLLGVRLHTRLLHQCLGVSSE